jgi:hypothetical protein
MVSSHPPLPPANYTVSFSVFLCVEIDLADGRGEEGDPERLILSKSYIRSAPCVQWLHERRGIRQGHGRPQHGFPLELLGSTVPTMWTRQGPRRRINIKASSMQSSGSEFLIKDSRIQILEKYPDPFYFNYQKYISDFPHALTAYFFQGPQKCPGIRIRIRIHAVGPHTSHLPTHYFPSYSCSNIMTTFFPLKWESWKRYYL